MDILDFRDAIVRIVNIIKAGRRIEVQHVCDLIPRSIQPHQMLQRRQTLKVLQPIACHIDVLEVLKTLNSVKVNEILLVDSHCQERMPGIVESLAQVAQSLLETNGILPFKRRDFGGGWHRNPFNGLLGLVHLLVHLMISRQCEDDLEKDFL